MNPVNVLQPKGEVEAIIETDDGRKWTHFRRNTILDLGRAALASSLANDFIGTYEFYIANMIFGDDGTSGGEPRFVDSERTTLFGTTRVNKAVTGVVDPLNAAQSVFTAVIDFSEGNGYTLNEMALVMENGDLYSMVTFPDLNKTSSMQITWNWRLSFI